MAERALGLLSATELVGKLRDREVSSRELLAHFAQRRATYNDELNAIVTVDDEAAERAASTADDQLAAGGETPPLLGLPMTIKDAIATKGMRSTGGAIELADHYLSYTRYPRLVGYVSGKTDNTGIVKLVIGE